MISIVIPAYNEAGRIGKTVLKAQPYAGDVIVVDDASTDTTIQEALSAGARVVQMDRNRGYVAAIKRGFQEARGEIVVTIDADGEFPAERIPDFLHPILDNHADMVQGHRDIIPRLSEKLLNWIANQIAPVGDTGTGMRALRTEIAKDLKIQGVCICAVLSLEVASKGWRISEVPIHLCQVDKQRRIAWFHIKQLFYIVPWLFVRYKN